MIVFVYFSVRIKAKGICQRKTGSRSRGLTAYHAGPLLCPCEGERGIACPLTVQRDIRIHVHCHWLWLYHQDRTNFIEKKEKTVATTIEFTTLPFTIYGHLYKRLHTIGMVYSFQFSAIGRQKNFCFLLTLKKKRDKIKGLQGNDYL